ncbi:MAG: YigZ family protein [Firmicutes bacterium]|nr:YigZ family protein [Bacillota bacterium]
MSSSFLTLEETAQAEITIKKSRFITSAAPINTQEEAEEFIKQISSKHNNATHNVFAYVINEQIQRYSDDGEPSGTAGKPILEVINRKGLVKTVLVVTRYFGGIMLGAGGLVRAYSEAAVKGVETARIAERKLHSQIFVTMNYHLMGVVKREVEKADSKKIKIDYGEQVKMNFYLQPQEAQDLINKLVDVTAAKINVKEGKQSYI